MRLAFLYNANSFTNAQYRALMPMTMLERRGHEIVWFGSSTDDLPIERLRGCDLIHVYRAADARLLKSLAFLQDNGVALTWDNDDDVTAVPPQSPSYSRLGGVRGQRDFRQQMRAMQMADLVTTTSRALETKFKQAGARCVKIIENYLPPEFARGGPKKRHDGVVIGWAALREHEADVTLLSLREVLTTVLEDHPRARLVTVGLNLDINHARYECRPQVPFDRFAATLRDFDIGLAPLADITFNRARSNIKLKEYGIASVPWLASPVGEYATLGAKHGGRLVASEDWQRALADLIRSRLNRFTLGTRGRLWARRQTIELHAHAWEQAFQAQCRRSD